MKISIVTLTYGHERFIKQAIEGVLMQKGEFEIEMIVANDNSPDNTDLVVREIININVDAASKIRYIKHSSNLGATANFIWALKQCKGQYIAICEGDDYWTDPNKLKRQVDFLEANPGYVLTHHDASVIDENGNHLKNSKLPLYKKKDFDERALQRGVSLATLTLCFRNVFLNKVLDLPNVVNGDMALISILGLYGKGKYIENIENACYRVHSGGIWSQTSRIKQNTAKYGTYQEMSKYYFRLGFNDLGIYYRKKLNQQFHVLFLYYIRNKNIIEAFKYFIKFNLYYLKSNFSNKFFLDR